MLREIGDRVRKEVHAAAKRIEASRAALSWDDATGVLAIVAPPSVMRRDLVAWIVKDCLSEGKYPAVHAMILASTPYLAGGRGERGDSHLSFHGRSGFALADSLKRRIGMTWARLHGQPWKEVDEDPLLGPA